MLTKYKIKSPSDWYQHFQTFEIKKNTRSIGIKNQNDGNKLITITSTSNRFEMFKKVKKAPDKRLKVLCLEEKIKCLKVRIEETYPAEKKMLDQSKIL